MNNVAIFDLDGTLVDTPRAIVDTFTATFAYMGVPACEAADIRATIGLPLEKAFSQLMGVPLDDDKVTLSVRQYQFFFKEIVLPKAEELIFPGVVDGLSTLRDQGFILTVATSKFYASADALLKAAGLRDKFSVLIGADQVSQPKPHPESGYVIMQKLGIPAERAVMVGDTTHDLLMAKAAGMRSVAVTYGVHSLRQLQSVEPTWIARTFDDAVRVIADGMLHDETERSAAT